MRKYLYLCFVLLLGVNTMGQIDLNDGNWESVINDDFNGVGRSWNAPR